MRAIVTGVSGQDGFYMASLLQQRGIEVLGLTRDVASVAGQFAASKFPQLRLHAFDYAAPGLIKLVVDDFRPDLIFNFAAKATGQGMFDAPTEMSRLNGVFVLDILEAITQSGREKEISFCQASSSEMFGNVQETPQSERTALWPKSPYGAAKSYAHNLVAIYRTAYGLRCCSAILYNHESIRRSTQFVTKKIAHGAAAIRLGLAKELSLGSLSIERDWGYAPEYVEAMYLMATAGRPADYVVATGRLNTIARVCDIAFGHVGLDYRDHVRVSEASKRGIESLQLHGDPSAIKRELGWQATWGIEKIMVELVDHELQVLRATR